jgi:hypothetical protein
LKLLREKRFAAARKIFAVDYYTLNRQPKEEVVSFYAQSWLIIHYLMHADKRAPNSWRSSARCASKALRRKKRSSVHFRLITRRSKTI